MPKRITKAKFVLVTAVAPDESMGTFIARLICGRGDKVVKVRSKDDFKAAIPLIICSSRDDLKRMGAMCPYEFIITNDETTGESDEINGICYNVSGKYLCLERLAQLKRLYLDRKVDFFGHLRDWFSGTLRRYMLLDESVHGTSSIIDLDRLDGCEILRKAVLNEADSNSNKDEDKVAVKLRHRFCGKPLGGDEMNAVKKLLHQLYEAEIDELTNAFRNKDLNAAQKIYRRCRIDYRKGDAVPHPMGERAKFVTANNKIDVLLIDDDPVRSRLMFVDEKDLKENSGLKLCGELFQVQPFCVNVGGEGGAQGAFKRASETLQRIQEYGLSYDLALVDLCLGDRAGGDLSGYRMIKKVRKYFPGMPIVVYSKFRDMGHIVRALHSGARWFLVKGEEDRLPRHVLTLLKSPGWHREWDAIKAEADPVFLPKRTEDDFVKNFHDKPEWQYLTYKSLEYFPGKFITVKKMGGGISSAVTFRATKGVRLDGEFLQSPSIVKIDSSYNTMMEFERYFRYIRPYVANQSGRIESPAHTLNRDFSSIVYTFAGKHDAGHGLESMSSLLQNDVQYKSACDYEKYRTAFDIVFDEILPQIHRVTPEREFGEGKNEKDADLHSGAVDSPKTPNSAFPNASFGEVKKCEFWKSYVARMQPWAEIKLADDALFRPQPKYDDSFANALEDVDDVKFTFHNVFKRYIKSGRGGGCFVEWVIEAYMSDGRLVWLKGSIVNHIAQFRRQIYPGKTLWVSKEKLIVGEDALKTEGRTKWLADAFSRIDTEQTVKKEDRDSRSRGGAQIEFCNVFSAITGKVIAANRCKWFFDKLQDQVIELAKRIGSMANKNYDFVRIGDAFFRTPVAIIHGDLNYSNVMLEFRKSGPQAGRPDGLKDITGAWFIDFARTRRDIITHDFNVMFTSTLSLLFDSGWADRAATDDLKKCAILIRKAVTDESQNLDDIPDEIADDARLTMIYKMLRRIRFAALKAGVSSDMYLLTTALASLYTFKIYLNHGGKVRLAAGLMATAKICWDILVKKVNG